MEPDSQHIAGDIQEPRTNADPVGARRDYGKARPYLGALGGVAGFVFALLFSNDYCCTAVGAGLLGLLVVTLIDKIVCAFPSMQRTRRDVAIRAAVALAIPLGLALVPPVRFTGSDAFRLAFGFDAPDAVSEFGARRHYVGGPGDNTVFLKFHCKQWVIDDILARRQYVEDNLVGFWNETGHDWNKLVDRVASVYPVVWPTEWWENLDPMVNPQFYRWVDTSDIRGTLMIWDPETERVYAVFVQG